MSITTRRVTIGKKTQEALMAEWRDAIRKFEIERKVKRPTGDGWIKANDLDKMKGISRKHVYEFFRCGRAERFDGVDINKAGKLSNVRWYRLKK